MKYGTISCWTKWQSVSFFSGLVNIVTGILVSIHSPTRNTASEVEVALANDERPISEAAEPFSPWIYFEIMNTSHEKMLDWGILRFNGSCMRSTKHSLGVEHQIESRSHWDSLTTTMVQSSCSLLCWDEILGKSDNHHIRWIRQFRSRIGFTLRGRGVAEQRF